MHLEKSAEPAHIASSVRVSAGIDPVKDCEEAPLLVVVVQNQLGDIHIRSIAIRVPGRWRDG